MNLLQAVAFAILQGATELFPVSSLGHAVVLPKLLGWNIDQESPQFLPFLVLLHAGTAAALLIYFWRDWWTLFRGVIGMDTPHQVKESRRVTLLIIVATIPAAVVGFLLEHFVRTLFGSPVVAACFLMVNAVILAGGEALRKMAGYRTLSSMTWKDAFLIGCWQCLALVPGISRSGATMVGGLLRGINHAGAAHFSFLIATPIIVGATLHQVPKLLKADVPHEVLQLSFLAAVLAAITAYVTTAFLMRYFRNHDQMALNPFAYYCFFFGLGSLALLLFVF